MWIRTTKLKESSFKMNKSTVILTCVKIALLLGIVYLFNRPLKNDYLKQKSTIDSLTSVISGLETEQIKYDSIIKGYEGRVDTLSKKVNDANNKLEVERKKHGKKIDHISKLNVAQLDSFFTNRYR
jgi:hypothetical protein